MNLLFDLDGTLTDPSEGIVACHKYALSRLGIELDEGINLENYIGPPLRQVFRDLGCDDELTEQAVDIYRERFATTGLYENRLHDGMVECLENLAGRVKSSFIVTSKASVYSRRIAEHFDIHSYFKNIYGSNLDGTLSDKTELLKHVIDSENIDPADAVMIGDRKFDIIGAKNHGIRSIGVLWGFGSEDELLEAGAGSLCDQPANLADHIFRT